MIKYVDNPEKENDPKHYAGEGGGGPYDFLLFIDICHNMVLKESLMN